MGMRLVPSSSRCGLTQVTAKTWVRYELQKNKNAGSYVVSIHVLFMSLFRKNNSLSVLLSEKLPEIERKCSSNQDLSRKDVCPKRLPWQKDVLRPEPGAVRAQGSGDRLTTARMLSQHLARPCPGRLDGGGSDHHQL